jgi:hypothetical protein
MSDHQSRTASDDLYDHEREEPRSGRRRRPVADWGVGDDMFEHMPRNRFSRVAEGPPRDRRFSRAAEADRREADADEGGSVHQGEAAERAREWDEMAARDDSQRQVPEEPIRWTGPHRDDVDEDETPGRRAAAAPQEGVPRGRVEDGRRTIVIGKPEDVPSEIAAITADRDLGEEPAPELPPPGERRTVRIGGHPEGSLEAARFHRDRSSRRRPPRRAHERLGARPDRIAMWAFALGLLLIVIAILSAH